MAQVPPILFVHGNGDHAALWMTTLWRMESNGIPRDRLFTINFTDPQARTDDAVPEQNRSSSEDQRRELGDAVKELKRRTGAPRVALVANSRGGNSVRSFIKAGGSADVSHAVLCGVPNHGVFDWDDGLGNEFNGRGPFPRGLKRGRERSDGRYLVPDTAQRRLRQICPGRWPLRRQARHANRNYHRRSGVARRHQSCARNHRPSRDGLSPARLSRDLQICRRARTGFHRDHAEPQVRLSGLVTGTPGGIPTNRPVADASVEIFRTSPETGERLGGAIHTSRTAADGRWGPVRVDPMWTLEIVLAAAGSTTTHYYRSPFPRSSDVLHLRAARALGPADAGAGAVVIMARPRGYFGLPRDVVLFDGKEPADVKPGVPADAVSTVRLSAAKVGRPVTALFNQERIVARGWPASENRISIAELTY
jgi:hypothetical protein